LFYTAKTDRVQILFACGRQVIKKRVHVQKGLMETERLFKVTK